ncbi:MAG: Transcriptional regulator, AraC family [Myxococcales bacterium]|nr:Transcriptional regulator, AraC family [Myxococcales bacterium]
MLGLVKGELEAGRVTSKEVPSSSPLPPALLRWLAARGLDASLVAARVGLPADAAERDEVLITPSRADEMMQEAAALVGDPFLALRLPAELPFRRYGLHEVAARAAGTVQEALERTTRYASLIHPRLELTLEVAGTEARWRQRMRGYPRGIGRATHEYGLGSAAWHLGRAVERATVATRVWFVHARPRDLAPYHRFFGTRELDFGCDDNGYAFDAALLALPMTEGDPRLLATVEPLAEAALRAQPPARDFADEVAARIRALLPDSAGVEAVAAALHMSARTLQRRLGETGAQFSEVLDAVRADEARRALVEGELPLAEIGWRLGFADLATFSRAFKRWTGKPPGTFRRDGRGGAHNVP